MKHYDSIENIKYDQSLLGEEVWAFNKLDGQNFCVKYSPKTKEFPCFGSRKCIVGEGDEMFGGAIDYFKSNNFAQILRNIVDQNRGKKGVFNGIDEITFFFEWYGPKSFAGFHSPGDTLRLAIIDVFLKKKGYLEPGVYWKLFKDSGIEVPDLIYRGKLTRDFVKEIQENDWTREDSKYPNVKEGVVVKRSTLSKGQRLLKTKIKTSWWLSELQKRYTPEECKLLE